MKFSTQLRQLSDSIDELAKSSEVILGLLPERPIRCGKYLLKRAETEGTSYFSLTDEDGNASWIDLEGIIDIFVKPQIVEPNSAQDCAELYCAMLHDGGKFFGMTGHEILWELDGSRELLDFVLAYNTRFGRSLSLVDVSKEVQNLEASRSSQV